MKIKSRHHLKGSDARKVIAAIEPFLEDSIVACERLL